MKKRSLTLLTLIFGICLLIFACRKELKNVILEDTETFSAPSSILESAKIWNSKVLSQTSKVVNRNKNFITLKPRWKEAWTVKGVNGIVVLVVPTVESHVNNRAVNIRRVFVFESIDNQVASGKILELVGFKYNVNRNLDALISKYHSLTIDQFNGAIIEYNLNYQRIRGYQYKNGVRQTGAQAAIISRSRLGKNIASKTLPNGNPNDNMFRVSNLDLKGNILNEEVTYLYTPSSAVTSNSADGSGSGGGSGSGDGSGSQLEDVTIIGSSGGGTGGSGGGSGPGYGGNPNPGYGGGSGGGSGGTGGSTVALAVNVSSGARLCGGFYTFDATTIVGEGKTFSLENLGFVATIVSSGSVDQVVNAYWGVVCVTIPTYGNIHVDYDFVAAYNAALSLIVSEIKNGLVPWEGNAIKLAFQAQILLLLPLGSSFTTGPCQGNIPSYPAVYCLKATKVENTFPSLVA